MVIAERCAVIVLTQPVEIVGKPSKCYGTETRHHVIQKDCSEHKAALQQDEAIVDYKCLDVARLAQNRAAGPVSVRCKRNFATYSKQVVWRSVHLGARQ